jgi:hypothetical protein
MLRNGSKAIQGTKCQRDNELNGLIQISKRALRNTIQQFQEYLVAEK